MAFVLCLARTVNVFINGTDAGLEASAGDAVGLNMTDISDNVLYIGRNSESFYTGVIDEVTL